MRWATTSIMVTHDVQESLLIVDYVYFIGWGRSSRKARRTKSVLRRSFCASVRFAEADGPVHFHYPAPLRQELMSEGGAWLKSCER
jgi:phospholipid/cholesterol/gamma-HCH transport system ATP-binding protein